MSSVQRTRLDTKMTFLSCRRKGDWLFLRAVLGSARFNLQAQTLSGLKLLVGPILFFIRSFLANAPPVQALQPRNES